MSPRHAYREPAPRLHLLAAVANPAAPQGRRVTLLADDTPRVPTLTHGPADLSLVWELPVLAVQSAPNAAVRVVTRTRRAVLSASLNRHHEAVMRIHHRAAELRHANERHLQLLLEKLELRAWQRLPRATKLAGQSYGHALAAAYDQGGTQAMLGLAEQVREAIRLRSLDGPLVNGTYHAAGGAR